MAKNFSLDGYEGEKLDQLEIAFDRKSSYMKFYLRTIKTVEENVDGDFFLGRALNAIRRHYSLPGKTVGKDIARWYNEFYEVIQSYDVWEKDDPNITSGGLKRNEIIAHYMANCEK